MSAEEYLGQLPAEYDEVSATASSTLHGAITNVQSYIERLEAIKATLGRREPTSVAAAELLGDVKTGSASTSASFKEWVNNVNKAGKDVEKRFAAVPVDNFDRPEESSGADDGDDSLMIPAESSAERRAPTTPFSEANVASALDEAVIGHLCRIGAFDAADALSEEACLPGVSSPELVAQLRALHAILDDLRGGWSARAFEWLGDALLDDDNLRDELEFELRKEDFVRILLAEHDCATSGTCPRCSAQVQAALAYGGQYLRSLASPARLLAVKSLFASVLYLPRKRLRHSPYAGLYAPYLADHAPPLNPHVESMLTAAFLKTLRLPQRSPLSIVADIGGSGSVAKIQKVRNVMKAKRTEWSAVGELPIHIPVPVSHRYHSIFACPVSKEQATATNPPMLLPCGHAIARESLHRLGKGGSSVKCPYCPVVSQITAAIPLHF